MKEKFVTWFENAYPGMAPDGPTGKDEWVVYSQGYMDGMKRMIKIYEGTPCAQEKELGQIGTLGHA